MKTKPAAKQILKTAPTRCRGGIARGLKVRNQESGKQESGNQEADAPAIERSGGDKAAGLIRGVAVCTRGEALGHGTWLDAEFLSQTQAAVAETGERGLKSRFTHPGLSADGMGKFLGRLKNPTLDGDVVRADVHLDASAHSTPDGDLADYLMTLAESDPESFGTSIVYWADRGAEMEFAGQNSDEEGNFTSPDAANEKNLPHARLAALDACDVVDEPAANPGGLFSRGRDALAREGWDVMDYALALTDERPALCQLDADPDRIRQFVQRYLAEQGLEVRKVGAGERTPQRHEERRENGTQEKPMSDAHEPKTATAVEIEARAQARADEIVKAAREEEQKIRALCRELGQAEQAERYITAKLTLAEVKDQLLELRKKEFALSETAGGNVTDQPAKPDPNAAAKAEYAAEQKTFKRHGVTEEQYLRSRQIDAAGGVVVA